MDSMYMISSNSSIKAKITTSFLIQLSVESTMLLISVLITKDFLTWKIIRPFKLYPVYIETASTLWVC